MTIRVALADDQALVRAGFRMIVESQPGMEVAGEAADGQEAIELVRRERPASPNIRSGRCCVSPPTA